MKQILWLALSAIGTAAFVGADAAGQETGTRSDGGVPTVFRSLEGAWIGTGTLMGRSADFTMEWGLEADGFVRLGFANAFVDGDGNPTTVLRAEAVYLVQGTTAQGVWIDSRPQRIRLEASVDETRVETTWTADSERGRTEYVVVSPGEVRVRDFVEVDGALRPFGEATYRRR